MHKLSALLNNVLKYKKNLRYVNISVLCSCVRIYKEEYIKSSIQVKRVYWRNNRILSDIQVIEKVLQFEIYVRSN